MAATAALAGASALGSGIGQAASSGPSFSELDDRSVTNIAPVGVNLGAILRPFNEGSSTNGGSPMSLDRFSGGNGSQAIEVSAGSSEIGSVPAKDPEKDRNLTLLVMAGAGLAAFLIVRMV